MRRPRTVGAIDMGGASMQFAMEITRDDITVSERESLKGGVRVRLRTDPNKRAMALYTCVDKGNKSATGLWQPLRPLQPPNSLRDQIWTQV